MYSWVLLSIVVEQLDMFPSCFHRTMRVIEPFLHVMLSLGEGLVMVGAKGSAKIKRLSHLIDIPPQWVGVWIAGR